MLWQPFSLIFKKKIVLLKLYVQYKMLCLFLFCLKVDEQVYETDWKQNGRLWWNFARKFVLSLTNNVVVPNYNDSS